MDQDAYNKTQRDSDELPPAKRFAAEATTSQKSLLTPEEKRRLAVLEKIDYFFKMKALVAEVMVGVELPNTAPDMVGEAKVLVGRYDFFEKGAKCQNQTDQGVSLKGGGLNSRAFSSLQFCH